MPEEVMIMSIVFFVMISVVIIFGIIAGAIKRRGASRKELQELREDISQMKTRIEEIREQLADIIIRLG
jgi:type II secretory pathway component PulM